IVRFADAGALPFSALQDGAFRITVPSGETGKALVTARTSYTARGAPGSRERHYCVPLGQSSQVLNDWESTAECIDDRRTIHIRFTKAGGSYGLPINLAAAGPMGPLEHRYSDGDSLVGRGELPETLTVRDSNYQQTPCDIKALQDGDTCTFDLKPAKV